MDENNICPDCGHQLTAEDQQTKETIEEINADETMQDKSTEDAVFPDTELNDPIEWSELKDLPLESVMELFEKTESEDDVSSTHDKVANKEKGNRRKRLFVRLWKNQERIKKKPLNQNKKEE